MLKIYNLADTGKSFSAFFLKLIYRRDCFYRKKITMLVNNTNMVKRKIDVCVREKEIRTGEVGLHGFHHRYILCRARFSCRMQTLLL